MPNVLRRAAVAVVVAAASIATVSVPGAHATTAPVADTTTAPVYPNAIWAGYWAISSEHVTEAFAQFKVPTVDCGQSRGRKSYMASLWAGIGGVPNGGYGAGDGKASWLEQDGIIVYCKNKESQAVYKPFWEVVPPTKDPAYPSRDLYSASARVHPTDEITAIVIAPGTTEPAVKNAWTFEVTDYSFKTGEITTWTHRNPNVPKGDYGLSADAIGECTGGNSCPYLGTVTFDHADYTVTSGESYSIPGTAAYVAYLEHPVPGPVAIYPSNPYGDLNDTFDLYYTSYWWR
jgi:hypothetical protein